MTTPSAERAQLVLVTSNYPFVFNGGEVMFVAPEIPSLLQAFDTVRVAPLHAEGERVPMPAGVIVDTSLSDAMRRNKWAAFARAMWWPGFGAEMLRAVRRGGWVGAARVWRWAATAQVTYRWASQLDALQDDRTKTVLYTYWRGGSTMAFASLAKQRAHLATASRVHRYELYEDSFDPPFQPWHPAMYDEIALTAAISQHGFDYLRAAGVAAERLMLARLGTPPAKRPTRASDDGTLQVISCSFVAPVKRVPLIAESLIAFAAKHPECSLHWTHFGDGQQLAQVKQMLRSAPPNLHSTMTGHVSNDAVMKHYADEPVDVFVLLSESEGLPVSIQEAASASIPIIATDVGGVSELGGADNGVLLPSRPSVDEVVAALEQVLLNANAQTRESMRVASLSRWAEGFDAQRNHTRFAQRLRSLATRMMNDHLIPNARSAPP
jgi:colanic acid/amylovoran biosynthesis glycosyltransferase